MYKRAALGKQWKTIIILSILNFALSNGLSTWVKFISSGLGAILFPIVDCYITFGVKLAKLAILGLTISFSCLRHFFMIISDFLQPDFRFGILLSFIATISWALEVYTLRKAATILALGYKC
jgi:hypothetical protein